MIVNISGASSTGKTSLVETLKQHHKPLLESIFNGSVVFGQESIREVASIQYSGRSLQDIFQNKEDSLKIQFDVARYNYELYTELIKRKDVLYIFDRGPIDNLVYTMLCYNTSPVEIMAKYSKDFSKYCALNRSIAKYADLVFLTKADNLVDAPEDDGFRPQLFSLLRKAETELFSVILDKPDVIELPSDCNERLVTFFGSLKDYLRQRRT